MANKVIGRAALILATGIWIGLSGASQAAPDADGSTAVTVIKHSSRHLKQYTDHKTRKVTDATVNDKKAVVSEDSDNPGNIQSSGMPASVANANAQLVSHDTPAGSARAMTDRANNIFQATPDDAQAAVGTPVVVAADQLNDVDRALHEGAPATAPVMLASAEPPDAVVSPAAAVSPGSESSIWDQTSLIGKIFIGFGALLTVASAARMFMT
jgi:hypothetical protein